MALDGPLLGHAQPLAGERPRRDGEPLLREPARHRIADLHLGPGREDGPAQLGGEVLREPPPGERARRGLVQLGHHDLRVRLGRADLGRVLLHRDARVVLDEPERMHQGAHDARADLHPVPDGPEPEEPDAVLAGDHEPPALVGAELALLGAADVGGDESERLLATEPGQHALPVVAHHQGGAAAQPPALDGDVVRVRVDRVLHELRHRLSRIGLGAGEPADEVEGVRGAEDELSRGSLGHAPV